MFNPKMERSTGQTTFYGNYRGEVVSVSDKKEAARVRIRVMGVYDNVPDSALPWAQYADPFFMSGVDSGSQIIPDIGDMVWVFFEGGNHTQPIYFAGAPSAKDMPKEASPKNRVIKTKKGHIIELDDTDEEERVKITHSSGSYVEMNDAGEGTWSAPKLDLGEGGLEPMVLGDKLAAWAESLVQWLDTHQHYANLGFPTSVPIVPNQPTSEPAIFNGGNVYSTKNRNQ